MSWVDAVQSQLIIKTGDGKQFSPLWKNSCAKEIEYNIAQFDFPKIAGSLVNRGTPTARKFTMEIYFQGENNLDDALAFEISANDPRPWTISHPIYGNILVQPVGLKFDYSGYNITAITGTIIETLGSPGLKITILPIDKINADKVTVDEKFAESFSAEEELLQARKVTAADLAGVNIKQVTTLTGINKAFYDLGIKSVKLTEDAGTYLNLFNTANAAVSQLINAPLQTIQAVQALINFPGIMVTSIVVRLSLLQSQLNALKNQLDFTNRGDKKLYEVLGGGIISSMAQGSVTSYDAVGELANAGILPDYKTRKDVVNVIDTIQIMHSNFLTDIDNNQTDNGGLEDSYLPDPDSIIGLNSLINFTISNLSSIALNAKQERSVVLNDDSNVILLAHRFYGLQVDDSTIQTFMENNDIFLNEILAIKKGRTLIYYI
jgi:hypothetical protein